MLQEQKPKKMIRKKTKVAPIVRTPKHNKKKKKQIEEKIVAVTLPPPSMPPTLQKQHVKLLPPIDTSLSWNHSILSNSDNMHMIVRSPSALSPSLNHYFSENANMYQYTTTVPSLTKLQQQEMFTVCENSSAYESSEDTGVGGLSETELIGAPDCIGILLFDFLLDFRGFNVLVFLFSIAEIPLGDARLLEEHDLNNVLNQLPEDAFNDLFEGKFIHNIFQSICHFNCFFCFHFYLVQQNDHYEPTQKEQDELARALEEVDEQVKSLEQMTGSTDFLDNFLGVDDEILTTTSVKNDIRGLVHT